MGICLLHFLSLLVWLIKRTLYFVIFFKAIFLPCRVPTFRDQKVVKHGRHRGISFLHIDWTRSICKSMTASLWFKSFQDLSLLKSYNVDLWINIYKSVDLGGWSGLFCWIPWLLCLWPVICLWYFVLIQVSPIMISAFKKSIFIKQKSSWLLKKSLISG